MVMDPARGAVGHRASRPCRFLLDRRESSSGVAPYVARRSRCSTVPTLARFGAAATASRVPVTEAASTAAPVRAPNRRRVRGTPSLSAPPNAQFTAAGRPLPISGHAAMSKHRLAIATVCARPSISRSSTVAMSRQRHSASAVSHATSRAELMLQLPTRSRTAWACRSPLRATLDSKECRTDVSASRKASTFCSPRGEPVVCAVFRSVQVWTSAHRRSWMLCAFIPAKRKLDGSKIPSLSANCDQRLPGSRSAETGRGHRVDARRSRCWRRPHRAAAMKSASAKKTLVRSWCSPVCSDVQVHPVEARDAVGAWQRRPRSPASARSPR